MHFGGMEVARQNYLIEEPLDSRHEHGQSFLILEQRDGLLALLHDVHLDVVLKILTDSGQVANCQN